jgi:hypothetical protein
MKCYKLLIPVLFIVACNTTSCKKFLDQPVLGNYEAGTFFTSDANAQTAINAGICPVIVSQMAVPMRSGYSETWLLMMPSKAGLEGDQADFQNINDFNIIPSNSAVEAVWKRYYDGVFKCNAVISGLPDDNTAVSDAVKTSCIGQAKFLRAYYYFILTGCYGNIPVAFKGGNTGRSAEPCIAAGADLCTN